MSLVFRKIPGNFRIMRTVLLSLGQAMALQEERAEQERLHQNSESNTEHPSAGREDTIVTEDDENGPSKEEFAQHTEYTEDEDEDENAENTNKDKSVHKGAGNACEDKRVPKRTHKQQDPRSRARPRRYCSCNHQPNPDSTMTVVTVGDREVTNPLGVALVLTFCVAVTTLSLWAVFESPESVTWTVTFG